MRFPLIPFRIRLVVAICVSASLTALADEPFTIHEWGTFTVLQDEAGRPLRGVNVNEERFPHFVFRLDSSMVPDSHALSPLAAQWSKGLPSSFPASIMRLETPILYIYPPHSDALQEIDVGVRFRGGWISEWYPDATVTAPGFERSATSIGNLKPSTKRVMIGRIELVTPAHRRLLERIAAGPPSTSHWFWNHL